MNNQEVKSAINDFRRAFKEDLGAMFAYGEKTASAQSGGFSIDEESIGINWVDRTSSGESLYCTAQIANQEELLEAGLSQNSTGIVTCIYEDILDLQQDRDVQGNLFMSKELMLDDVIVVFLNGYKQYYRIVDFNFAFQLKNTYIFIKFGVIDMRESELDGNVYTTN